MNKSHGLSTRPIYASWESMKARCFNPNTPKFSDYGGRGITVCENLRSSPERLLALIGDRPKDKSIDRIDPNGHYSCGTCAQCVAESWPLNVRWLTQREQTRNTRRTRWITLNGKRQSLADWAEQTGLTSYEFLKRLKNNSAT